MVKRQIDFNTRGYCYIKSAIDKDLVDFISQYALFDEKNNFSPDTGQVVGAHSKYADPAMESMLLKLLPLIEESTGLTVYPTYSFYRVYRNGDELTPHTDRPSCEISATVCFNFSYENYKWPIYMSETPFSLDPGDLVIYRGCEVQHYRPQLQYQNDCFHIQGFFHYVDSQGPYADYKYDNRESIGLSKNYKKYLSYKGNY